MLPSSPETQDLPAQEFHCKHRPALSLDLPAFVRPLPSRFAPEDIEYLRLKRAFTIPPLPLQNAFLQAFAEYIHPQLPLLEFHKFLRIVQSRKSSKGQVSLLLYHAVMFAAATYVDVNYLLEEGYASRREAQASLFQRARWLYDLEYESDRLTLVQVLLLLSYWNGTDGNHRESWYWIGAAISLAFTIDLHLHPEAPNMASSERKLRKRVWWSCFMRERLLSLENRRPTQICLEDSNLPMLEQSDFEIRPLPDGITVISRNCKAVRDASVRRQLAAICIARIQLCICISRMQDAQRHSLNYLSPRREDKTRPHTLTKNPADSDEAFNRVDEELLAWSESLPNSCQFRTLTAADSQSGQSVIAVQRTFLHLLYHTTVSMLHRNQMVQSVSSHAVFSRQVQHMSKWRVREATMHITRMASQLHHLRLELFLPSTSVSVFLAAATVHILEIKCSGLERRQHAVEGFTRCMEVLTDLSKLYPTANESIQVIRNSGVEKLS